MNINGREYELSPRRAVDVLELAAAVEKHGEVTNVTNTLAMAQVVSDSLKATGLSLGPVRGWRYRVFVKGRGSSLLINSLSTAEIVAAYAYVSNLEKKRVVEAASLLEER